MEVADTARAVLVRDTKDRDGTVIEFNARAWRAFASTIKEASAQSALPRCEP